MARQDQPTQSQFVSLISSDGEEFIISRDCAMLSGTIKSMLEGPGRFVENERNEIALREIRGTILERVCIYLYYKKRYDKSKSDLPDFDIKPEIVLELLMAANFLDA
eukprot:m.151358 g.151358  ORF g.151358 m.151358 type:complete len:107 (+) comp16198_c1_seq1:40-360(+)